MSGFKDMVARDNFGVFLNCDEFAEKRTVKYDGATYEDIPIVLSGLKEKDRRQLMSDHAQGLYIVSSVLHCALSDLGGVQPERGQRIRINDKEGGGGFFREFYVASSVCEMGMLRVELEAVDEWLYPRQRGRRRQPGAREQAAAQYPRRRLQSSVLRVEARRRYSQDPRRTVRRRRVHHQQG